MRDEEKVVRVEIRKRREDADIKEQGNKGDGLNNKNTIKQKKQLS